MQTLDYFLMLTHWVFLVALGYYVITNFQWYHYKFLRVVFKHHKFRWHIIYFILPVIYFIFIPDNVYSYIVLYLYVIALAIWAFNLSKKLIFTGRVLRFFFIYISFILFNDLLFLNVGLDNPHTPLVECVYLLPLPISLFLSNLLEKILLNRYKKLAKEKLAIMPNLKVIAITGSYGKTSLKNFLFQMLHEDFKVYTTPRSVNTLAGIIADINQNLSPLTDIYIIEAGARAIGNIKEIVDLVSPQIVVVGKIGEAHIEYFKDIQTIYATKYEILQSPYLQKAYIYEKNTPPTSCNAPIFYFPHNAKNINATLDGTTFSLELDSTQVEFSTKILGAFNVINISAAIAVAKDLGIPTKEIVKLVSKLEPTSHRLSKINVNNKLILDDSYNGNLDGMLEAIRLSSLHKDKKIIVTPGLVESNEESNIKLAQAIDKVFDIAIITGELNSKILQSNIHNPQKIVLKDKNHIENLLKSLTHEGDLILFANDAPSYI
ncbi:Mur ligase family protein [Helicobacter burdigaliensis]|uniref:Mur ligase family protein n=1 Tax=Helicobacter burdigaliensis TaxID=2315334 RepID=UPI000EF6CC53|nr:UDP-N-acetylmuramoyl-tripeptide--D-alanyl-D-alanine ligase [Helicobacter burdigaliensis]